MGSIVFKEITFTNGELNKIMNDLRQSGAIIMEYEKLKILIQINNLPEFINKFRKTESFNLSSLNQET